MSLLPQGVGPSEFITLC